MLKHIPFYGTLLGRELFTGSDTLATQTHVLVYGAIEVHDSGDLGCIASNKTIGEEVGLSAGRVANIISELNRAKWIDVILNEKRDRIGITPLLGLHATVKPVSRQSEAGYHARVNIDNNIENNKRLTSVSAKKEKIDNSELIQKLYKGWLIEFVIGFAEFSALDADSALLEIERATHKVRLTPKRRAKLDIRISDVGFDSCVRAIKHLANSPWHRGENERGWTASIEWLFNSVEKVEEWSNKK